MEKNICRKPQDLPTKIIFRKKLYEFHKGPLTKSRAEYEAHRLRSHKWPTKIVIHKGKRYLYVNF